MADNATVTTPERKLTHKDMVASFWRSGFFQGSWNYERVQNIGFCFQLIPAIRRLYPDDKQGRADAMKRQLTFMQITPIMASLIGGIMMAMEEEKANGTDIDDATITSLKVGMMGPMAGVGDPIFWGTIRPVLGAFAASLALSGLGIVAPLIFFIVWNAIRLSSRWYLQKIGYEQGTNIVENLGGGLVQKLTMGASILGMFIMGALVPRWTAVNMPLVISKVTTDGKTTVTTLQDVFDQLLPGLAPLLLMFFCLWLLRKKVNAVWIIFLLFALGIFGYWIGLFG
ncbi:PTS system mannose/fructose/sorbose family transporter subunit IID [Levilactobacillus bambusae]|uniref:PTS mannose transporter subunit IID n=1 Tax=Levilactobacillus bambusae TaxID=2024736 RepID=A0A2V1MZ98_9LACO|nr:PTS mannose transporter subunit IID [Levilactobacillus bambusae]PWF99409.1 PTS mannose transporter subunit IID [Levilactobacillus bambusae]